MNVFEKLIWLCGLSLILGCSPKPQPESAPGREHPTAHYPRQIQKKNQNAPAMTKELLEKEFAQVARDLNTSMVQCPERIWPNFSFKDIDVLLLSELTEPLIWRASHGTLEPFPKAKVPKQAERFIFSRLNLEGRKAVGIYVTGSDSWILMEGQLFKLIVHEGFHFYGQSSWESRSGSRGTVFPVTFQPRYERRMVYEYLLKAAQDPSQSGVNLSRAAHHHNQWMLIAPEEQDMTTDGYEGTARYVDQMAWLIAKGGCGILDTELQEKHNSQVAAEFESYFDSRDFELDTEGYGYGGLTSFILRFSNQVPNWTQLVAKGKTPAEILFDTVSADPGPKDTQLESEYKLAADQKNSEIDILIGTTLPDFTNPDKIRVSPASGSSGGYSPVGFFIPTSDPTLTLVPLAQPLVFQSAAGTLTADQGMVLLDTVTSPCPGSFIAVSSSYNLSSDQTQIKVTDPLLTGSLLGELKTDSKGLRWFCGK